MNTFSVLMSVYKNDSPEYLEIALDSICDKQTRRPDEIVVVFDGPLTERLLDVLSRFRAGREDLVRYLPQEVNRSSMLLKRHRQVRFWRRRSSRVVRA